MELVHIEDLSLKKIPGQNDPTGEYYKIFNQKYTKIT